MDPTFIALSVVILLFSVIVHEVMHGLVAKKFGDRTAENAGRLTLNPIPHIDPIGTILLPALFLILPAITGVQPGFVIGWAKPVPVNPLNFKDIKMGELMVSLAGVASNFGLAVISAILFHLLEPGLGLNNVVIEGLRFGVTINLALAIFNLLPIPPLDGSKALISLLPYQQARSLERLSVYGPLILIALLYFGVVGIILRIALIPLLALLQVPPV